jgi:hypothetical protein
MARAVCTEFRWRNGRNQDMQGVEFIPAGGAKAALLWHHGICEHSGRYTPGEPQNKHGCWLARCRPLLWRMQTCNLLRCVAALEGRGQLPLASMATVWSASIASKLQLPMQQLN